VPLKYCGYRGGKKTIIYKERRGRELDKKWPNTLIRSKVSRRERRPNSVGKRGGAGRKKRLKRGTSGKGYRKGRKYMA